MSYYAIGIGGTGAKCLESLIHLCAAGMMPDNEDLHVLFVDTDNSNGTRSRASELLESYVKCKSNQTMGTHLLKTEIIPADPSLWSPVRDGVDTLEEFTGYHDLTDGYKHLFDSLFTEEERTTSLEKGFRGHPSIGSVIMSSTVRLDDEPPWNKLKHRMEREIGSGTKVKIVLFGSIFGGTGAAGYPTIARLLRDWVDGFKQGGATSDDVSPVQIGGVLMLPYFKFDAIAGDTMHADSRDFLLNTQAALEYYYQQEYDKIFDGAYILGSRDLSEVRVTSIGSETQKNEPHWIELFAALAATDFFSRGTGFKSPYMMVSRDNAQRLDWTDLPYNTQKLRQHFFSLIRFSFALISTYLPALQYIATKEGEIYRFPWYVQFFLLRNVDVHRALEHEIKDVSEFCSRFLLWIANIEYSVTGKRLPSDLRNLVDFAPFANLVKDEGKHDMVDLAEFFDVTGFDRYGLPGVTENALRLEKLWEKMCDRKQPSDSRNDGWAFINALYDECGGNRITETSIVKV